MKRLCQFAVLALAVWPVAGLAHSNQSGRYMVLGYGLKSCGNWTEYRRKQDADELIASSWVTGFISSYNLFGPGSSDISKGTDVSGLLAWIDNYCAQHPLDGISRAAEELVDELIRRATH